MDVLRRLGAERPCDRLVERRARKEVLAADHVADPQVEVVDHRGEVVRRPPVRADERDPGEAERPLLVGLADRRACLAVPLGALALAERPFVPADSEPLELAQDLLLGPGHDAGGIGVVDPQDEGASVVVGEAAVGHGRERAAEVERPGRARGEAHPDAHDPPRPWRSS
jgi:hypothetical protein